MRSTIATLMSLRDACPVAMARIAGPQPLLPTQSCKQTRQSPPHLSAWMEAVVRVVVLLEVMAAVAAAVVVAVPSTSRPDTPVRLIAKVQTDEPTSTYMLDPLLAAVLL